MMQPYSNRDRAMPATTAAFRSRLRGACQGIRCTGVIALGVAGLSFAPRTAGATPLRSPWDLKPVVLHQATYSCPTRTALPKDISAFSFYMDEKHSKIDPNRYAAYNEVQDQFRGATAEVEAAADSFRATGNQSAAECVLSLLLVQAKAEAMTGKMASNQSYYVQNWTLGALAITWLKVRQANPGTPEWRAAVTGWMGKVASYTRAYFSERHDKNTNDGTNNHYYWAGFAVMAVGIATDDRPLFDWGVGTYNEAMSRIQPDGSLPLEMGRGQRALHYHVFALAPLTSMAEMASANGLDLYNANGGALHRLVKCTAAGLTDNRFFTAKAGIVQDTPARSGLKSEDVVWLSPYLEHFPNGDLSRLLHSVTIKPFGYLGGFPPP